MKKRGVFFFFLITFIFMMDAKAMDASATSAILMDIDSNRILYSKNIHHTQSVASISKVMTAIVAIENKDINTKVIVGEEIQKAYGSGIYVQIGEELTLKDLLYGLMLRSGNDAALVIAKTVAGSTEKFVKLMNEKAQTLKMKDSIFHNPSGLDQEQDGGNNSSAYDMAILMSYAYQNPTFREITGTKEYKLKTNKNVYRWTNKNKLLTSYPNTTGGKTGFTEKARRTLVTTASKNQLNLVVVTLNDGNDWEDHKNLFEYGFETYQHYDIFPAGDLQIEGETFYQDYRLYTKQSFTYPLTDSEKNSISIRYDMTKERKITDDQVVGQAVILLGEEEIGSVDIFVQNPKQETNLKKPNFIKRIMQWFKNLW